MTRKTISTPISERYYLLHISQVLHRALRALNWMFESSLHEVRSALFQAKHLWISWTAVEFYTVYFVLCLCMSSFLCTIYSDNYQSNIDVSVSGIRFYPHFAVRILHEVKVLWRAWILKKKTMSWYLFLSFFYSPWISTWVIKIASYQLALSERFSRFKYRREVI